MRKGVVIFLTQYGLAEYQVEERLVLFETDLISNIE